MKIKIGKILHRIVNIMEKLFRLVSIVSGEYYFGKSIKGSGLKPKKIRKARRVSLV
jgi:hypothetical protein